MYVRMHWFTFRIGLMIFSEALSTALYGPCTHHSLISPSSLQYIPWLSRAICFQYAWALWCGFGSCVLWVTHTYDNWVNLALTRVLTLL